MTRSSSGGVRGQGPAKPTPITIDWEESIRSIERERDGYYAEWKHSQNQIREIRWSLMWRASKASLGVRRLFNREEPDWYTKELVKAIEATPPDGKTLEKVPDLEAMGLTVPRKKILAAEREAHLKRVTFERDGYWGEWRHAQNRLGAIRSSALYDRWAPYRQFKARIGFLFYLLKVVRRLFVRTVLLPFRALAGLVKSVRKMPGVIYTGIWSFAVLARARVREGTDHVVGPNPLSQEEPDLTFRPRILIVSPYHIYPPNHGSGVRLINLVRELASSCDVYLLVFSPTGEDPEERAALEAICERVDYHRWLPHLRPDRYGLIPAVAEVFRSDRVTEKIRDIVRAHEIDIVQLEHAELGQYRRVVPEGIPVVLSEIDIAFRTQRRRRKLSFHKRFNEAQILHTTPTDVMRLFRYEIQNCQQLDQIHMMSEIDALYLARYLPDGSARLRVIPNGVNTDEFAEPSDQPDREDVLFLGNFDHLPNVDALDYLVTDIWPLVRLKIPTARLSVVGANPSARVRRLADRPGVTLVGEVPDAKTYYHSHRVMVAPIRAGSGTRLKILESFAAGIPVVSTSLGAEGIQVEHEKHILIADRVMDFANAIVRLLTDDPVHTSLANEARQLVRDRYDWRFVGRRMYHGYLELIPEEKRSALRSARLEAESTRSAGLGPLPNPVPDVSIVIPTFRGGADLERCLASISRQRTDLDYEVICIDSGSESHDLEVMRRYEARVISIEQREFNHGLTRDFGASQASGDILVFLSQDSEPIRRDWLDLLTEPLRSDQSDMIAAVQGGSREVIDPDRRFFWGTSGERFYFTSESNRWIERYGGIGFSTTNCAIRRKIWDRYRFGWATILEDKKWQRQIFDAGLEIVARPNVKIFHSHDYTLRMMLRRCASEGHGWKNLGERYRLVDALSDILTRHVWRELRFGVQQKAARSIAEIAFPVARPAALWWGNRFSRRVLH